MRSKIFMIHRIAVLTLIAAVLVAPHARAADKVTVGMVGQPSVNLWPVVIAVDKGYFADEGVEAQLFYVQSNTAAVQQIAAGSLDICMAIGLVDPMRAIQMGASIAILRIDVQVPPFALVAKSAIKSMKELKGKVVSLGGPKDITRIYVERMLEPNGVKPGEFDMIFAGATAARASAARRRGRCHDPDGALQLPSCRTGFQRARSGHRLHQGPATVRNYRQRELNQCAQGPGAEIAAGLFAGHCIFRRRPQSR